jgi:hypothetical protein
VNSILNIRFPQNAGKLSSGLSSSGLSSSAQLHGVSLFADYLATFGGVSTTAVLVRVKYGRVVMNKYGRCCDLLKIVFEQFSLRSITGKTRGNTMHVAYRVQNDMGPILSEG